MVLRMKMNSRGKHIKKINGKLAIDNQYDLKVNPHGKEHVFLSTQENSDKYKGHYESFNEFLHNFNNNNNSLFEMVRHPNNSIPKTRKKRHGFKKKFREINILKKDEKKKGEKGDTKKKKRFGRVKRFNKARTKKGNMRR